jgi:ABC-type nitrate/sulfonate/bicarbonate transport system permease component
MARVSNIPASVRRGAEALAPWMGVVALILVWELISRSGAVTRFTLPAFSVVMTRIAEDFASGELLIYLGGTLYRALLGFAIAAVLGVALGLAIARSRLGSWFFDPIVSFGFPMPKIAFVPVVVLWLGFHDLTKITMIVVDTVFPIITATIAGLRGVDMQLVWAARNMGASDRELLGQVLLPAALPEILTGLQVALPIAVIVAIIMEMMTGGVGLGAAMVAASRQADSPGVFAGLVEIAVVGVGLIKIMEAVRRRLLSWHQEAKAPTTV